MQDRSEIESDLSRKRRRSVILHFHTFKNAGSTVDAILQECFPNAWANYDGPVPDFFINHSEIALIARDRPTLKAISSHHIKLPNPDSLVTEFLPPDVECLPVVFIRRPELRTASLWRFMRQRLDDHPETLLAKKLDFKEWVLYRFENDTMFGISNLQTKLFSYRADKRTRSNDPKKLEYAMANFKALPFMGVVENFEESMQIYERLYAPKIPDFRYRVVTPKNVTDVRDLSDEEKLAHIADELGNDLFERLQRANSQDLALYELAHTALMAQLQSAGDSDADQATR